MGQNLSEPVTNKETIVAKNDEYYIVSCSMQGWRVSMEDAHTVLLSLPDDTGTSYFGVFDGHGGTRVSYFASRHLHKKIVEQAAYRDGDVKTAIEQGFLELDSAMQEEGITEEMGGSTAVIILIKGSRIFCGNAGDSRAIGCTSSETIALSYDHKPHHDEEKTRIEAAGAVVTFNRVNANLAVSRALGDFAFKGNPRLSQRDQAVTCLPDVIEKDASDPWQFIVLACDGIWDVMSSNEVGNFIKLRMESGTRPEDIVEQLVMSCLAPDGYTGGIGSDNMTVILIIFMKNTSSKYLNVLNSNSDDWHGKKNQSHKGSQEHLGIF